MVVPPVMVASFFGPVLTTNYPRQAIGVLIGHESMIPLVTSTRTRVRTSATSTLAEVAFLETVAAGA